MHGQMRQLWSAYLGRVRLDERSFNIDELQLIQSRTGYGLNPYPGHPMKRAILAISVGNSVN